ncbi:MAG TPA: DUF6677 family protein [Pyrinomonadaceae bacterium]|jgi:hypothetical protein
MSDLSRELQATPAAPRAFAAGLLTWAVPGAGYFLVGRGVRGIIMCALVAVMFVAGILLGGHLFGPHNVADAGLLAYVYGFCDFGMGLTYFACLLSNTATTDQAQRATAEYGNIFLIVAGLINYLAALDSFDIATGRKL